MPGSGFSASNAKGDTGVDETALTTCDGMDDGTENSESSSSPSSGMMTQSTSSSDVFAMVDFFVNRPMLSCGISFFPRPLLVLATIGVDVG